MYSNLSLLPHDETIRIKGIDEKLRYLRLMKYLIEEICIALYHFNSNQLHKFDAHVGETLCQIRAYKMLLIKFNQTDLQKQAISNFQSKLSKLYVQLKIIITQYENNFLILDIENKKNLLKEESISNFFKKNELFLEIPEEIIFIFLSYFLDLFRLDDQEGLAISVNYEKIAEKAFLSKNYSKRLTKYFQSILSKLSCDFVISLLDELPDKLSLKTIISFFYEQDDDKRFCLPCYIVTDIILSHMIFREMNLLIAINVEGPSGEQHFLMSYRGCKSKNDFILINEPNEFYDFDNKACLTVRGVCLLPESRRVTEKYVRRKLSVSVKNIILMNAAVHPQYTGESLKHLSVNPFVLSNKINNPSLSKLHTEQIKTLDAKFRRFQRLANKYGCSFSNQKTFFIKHILCDVIKLYPSFNNRSIFENISVAYLGYYQDKSELTGSQSRYA